MRKPRKELPIFAAIHASAKRYLQDKGKEDALKYAAAKRDGFVPESLEFRIWRMIFREIERA